MNYENAGELFNPQEWDIMRTKWQGLGIMSQSHFIATLTLKQTPINDGNLVKTNPSQENVSEIYTMCIHHCYRTALVIQSQESIFIFTLFCQLI